MIDLNNWHTMPRYGVAAALVRQSERNIKYPFSRSTLWELAKEVLPQLLNYVMLSPHPTTDLETVVFRPVPSDVLNPGNRGGQTAAKGYYIAPNVLSSHNAADIVKEVRAIQSILNKEDRESNYKLKKSFAPMIAKINAGKKSMSNPKIDILKAAFTAIATLTKLKPAAFIKDTSDNFGNAGIMPDMPFYDEKTETFPLIEYIRLLKGMMNQGLGDVFKSKIENGKFSRPKVFFGNYPYALRTFGIGSLSLVAAIGKWVEEHQDEYEQATTVLDWLSDRPIYIVSYFGTRQERFGHHLVDLTINGKLYQIIQKANHVDLIGVPNDTKFGNPKWQLFIRSLDHFLRFYEESSWQIFLMHRATYPIEFLPLLKSYFTDMKDKNGKRKYSDTLIKSAVAYGKYLNRAAYFAADKQKKDDKEKKIKNGRSRDEYKQQYLLQFESIIGSAQNGRELMSRLNTQAARITFYNPNCDVDLFVTDVANNGVMLQDAQHLITAFMRLSSYDPNEQKAVQAESEDTSAI